MKIEEAIKQTKPFESVYQKAGVNLMYTNGWYTGKLKTFFKSFDLTTKQYNILRILKGAKQAVSTSFVRERLLDKMSDVSRIVDRMHDKALITKSVCSIDKRLVDIELSELGYELLEKVKEHSQRMDKILNNLTVQEIETLNKILDKLRGN